jgi:hypothetical protein
VDRFDVLIIFFFAVDTESGDPICGRVHLIRNISEEWRRHVAPQQYYSC